MKKLVVIVAPGRFRELLSSLTLPVAVARMCNWLQRERPDVECHVIDGHLSFGQPVTEAGERKVHARLLDALDGLVDGETLVGFSTFANREIVHALPLARAIKARYGVPVVLGGYAASTCAELVASRYPDLFDGVVASAGEQAAVALMDELDGGRLRDRSRVPNLVYSDDGHVHVNVRVPAPRLRDAAPLDLSMIRDVRSFEMLPYFSSAGCPHRCDFCFEPRLYPKYDANRAGIVLRDIDAALGTWIVPRYVSFVDPLFGHDSRQAAPLLEGLRDRGVRYSLYTRVDTLGPELFERMAGHCALIFIGLEAFTGDVLTYMKKTRSPARYEDAMRRTARLAFEHGVTPQIGVIPNYPLNRRADVERIFRFFDELAELHESVCPRDGPGFLVTVFGYTIWHGLPHARDLADLEARGMTWAPGFPADYHGEPVAVDLRRDVRDASPDYTYQEFVEDRQRLYGKALATERARAHQADCYTLGFMNSATSTFVRLDGEPLVWTDGDHDVLDVKAMYDARIRAGGS